MIKNICDVNLKNKVVFLRVDYNVPIKDGVVENDARIRATIPTIKHILQNDAKLVILSHLGRIKTLEDIKKNSLKIVADKLQELLDVKVKFVDATRGEKVERAVKELNSGDVALLENVRYEDCDKKSNNFKWYFEIINKKSYLKSAVNDDICLIVDGDEIITGRCNENIDKAHCILL